MLDRAARHSTRRVLCRSHHQCDRDCSCFVLVFTERCNGSGHVLREVERALKFDKNIMPIRFDESAPSRSLDYLLATVHWLTVTGESESGIARAADQIGTYARLETGARFRPGPAVVVAKPAPALVDSPTPTQSPGRAAFWGSLAVGSVALILILGLLLTRNLQQRRSADRAPAQALRQEMPSPPATPPSLTVAPLRGLRKVENPSVNAVQRTKMPAAISAPLRTPAQTWDRPRLYLC